MKKFLLALIALAMVVCFHGCDNVGKSYRGVYERTERDATLELYIGKDAIGMYGSRKDIRSHINTYYINKVTETTNGIKITIKGIDSQTEYILVQGNVATIVNTEGKMEFYK